VPLGQIEATEPLDVAVAAGAETLVAAGATLPDSATMDLPITAEGIGVRSPAETSESGNARMPFRPKIGVSNGGPAVAGTPRLGAGINCSTSKRKSLSFDRESFRPLYVRVSLLSSPHSPSWIGRGPRHSAAVT